GLRRLAAVRVRAPFLASLAASPLAGRLTSLTLSGVSSRSAIPTAPLPSFEGSPLGPALTEVSFTGTVFEAGSLLPCMNRERLEAVEMIGAAPTWLEWLAGCASLRSLRVRFPQRESVQARHIASGRLRHLSLKHRALRHDAADAVFDLAHLRGVR